MTPASGAGGSASAPAAFTGTSCQDQRPALAQLHAARATALAAGHQGPADHDPPGAEAAKGSDNDGQLNQYRDSKRPPKVGITNLAETRNYNLALTTGSRNEPSSSSVTPAYGTHRLADTAIGVNATLTSRLRLDASLYDAPEPRHPGQLGRPRQKGRKRPRRYTHLDDNNASWTEITPPLWYGGRQDKTLEFRSGQVIRYRTGNRAKAIRWTLVRDPEGRRDPQAFFCTNPDLDPAQIIAIFVRRWQIEVTVQETGAHPGVETRHQWPSAAIDRTTPALLGLYSLICLWAGDVLPEPRNPAPPPGTGNPVPPSPTPSPPYAPNCGWRAVSNPLQQTGTGRNARRRHLPIEPSATLSPTLTGSRCHPNGSSAWLKHYVSRHKRPKPGSGDRIRLH